MSESTTYAFQWYLDGTGIDGATERNYTVRAADAGHAVSCAVTGSNQSGSTTVRTLTAEISSDRLTAYLTNSAGTALLTPLDGLSMVPYDGTGGTNPIAVDATTTFQTMDGFGAAVTDAAAWLLFTKMTPAQRSSLLSSLFGEDGYGLSALRICMGTPDFTHAGYYTYDDVPSGADDPGLASFSVAKDGDYIIPVLTEILEINPSIKIVAAPWSPPAWMKGGTSPSLTGGTMNSANFATYADYFVKFIQAYESAGLPIFAVSPQNEPENSSDEYPTCTWTAAQEATFITSFLQPALTAAHLTTKVLGYDHNWGDSGAYGFPQTLVSTAGVPADLYALAWHAYSGDETDQLAFAATNPGIGQWFTEICGDTAGTFGPDLSWHNHEIMIGSTRAGSRGVTYWNLVLDENSQPFENGMPTTVRPLVTIDSSSGAVLSYAPEFYALTHSAKFVTPGATRVSSTSYGSGYVESVAYLNPDGLKVCQLLCSAGSAQSFNLVDVDAALSCPLTLQPGDVVTLVWR